MRRRWGKQSPATCPWAWACSSWAPARRTSPSTRWVNLMGGYKLALRREAHGHITYSDEVWLRIFLSNLTHKCASCHQIVFACACAGDIHHLPPHRPVHVSPAESVRLRGHGRCAEGAGESLFCVNLASLLRKRSRCRRVKAHNKSDIWSNKTASGLSIANRSLAYGADLIVIFPRSPLNNVAGAAAPVRRPSGGTGQGEEGQGGRRGGRDGWCVPYGRTSLASLLL